MQRRAVSSCIAENAGWLVGLTGTSSRHPAELFPSLVEQSSGPDELAGENGQSRDHEGPAGHQRQEPTEQPHQEQETPGRAEDDANEQRSLGLGLHVPTLVSAGDGISSM